MAGKVKMRDLHNLLDLFEEASSKTSNSLSLSIMAFSHGGFRVTMMALDIQHDDNDKVSSVLLFRKDFDIDYEWSRENNATNYKECRDYLKHIIEGVKDDE